VLIDNLVSQIHTMSYAADKLNAACCTCVFPFAQVRCHRNGLTHEVHIYCLISQITTDGDD
jgi:hypothetical protein